MPGDEDLGALRGEVEVDRGQRHEQAREVALGHENALERSHQRDHRRGRDRQRAPSCAQRHAHRRFVGSVTANVPYHEPHAALV